MNKDGMAVFNAMSDILSGLDETEMRKLTVNTMKHLEAIIAIIKEHILNDKKLFEALFIMNFTEQKRLKVIAEYMGINHTSLIVSKDRAEIVNFSANVMTYESLAKMFPDVQMICGINLTEFIISWRILTQIGALIKIMFLREINVNDLTKVAARLYSKRNLELDIENILSAVLLDDEEDFSDLDDEDNGGAHSA